MCCLQAFVSIFVISFVVYCCSHLFTSFSGYEHFEKGKWDEARQLLEHVLFGYCSILSETHYLLFRCYHILAFVCKRLMDVKYAIKYAKQALACMEIVYPKNYPLKTPLLYNLAHLLWCRSEMFTRLQHKSEGLTQKRQRGLSESYALLNKCQEISIISKGQTPHILRPLNSLENWIKEAMMECGHLST